MLSFVTAIHTPVYTAFGRNLFSNFDLGLEFHLANRTAFTKKLKETSRTDLCYFDKTRRKKSNFS